MFASGIWGGTLQHERQAARGMPVEDAITVFDDSLPERLRILVDKWRAKERGFGKPTNIGGRRGLLRQWDADGTIDRIVDDLERDEATA